MKLLSLLIVLFSLNSFARDYKFHYGDKVTFTEDFYGKCDGTVDSLIKATKKLTCYKMKNNNTYRVTDNTCNGKYVYLDFISCESELRRIE